MERKVLQDGTILVRVLPGEEIVAALTEVLNEAGVFAGTVSAIGACRGAELALFDPKTKEYETVVLDGQYEILHLAGNVSRLEDGTPFPHVHVTLSDRAMKAFGGHLNRAIADPTCEIVVRPLPGVVERAFDAEQGLKLWRL